MKISSLQKMIEKDLDNYKKERLEKSCGVKFNKKQWEFFRDILVVGDKKEITNLDRRLDLILNI